MPYNFRMMGLMGGLGGPGVFPRGMLLGGPAGALMGPHGFPLFAPRPPNKEELVGRFKELLMDKGVRGRRGPERRRGRGLRGPK